MGDAHPSIAPYETVHASDGPFVLAVGNDAQFRRFAALVGLPALADDPRFATNAARVANRGALFEHLRPKLAERSRAEWDRALTEADIPGGPVLEVAQALEHPQMVARGSILSHAHPKAGTVRTLATPVRLDGASPAPLAPPPLLGQHTRQVLAVDLGLSPEAIAELERDGVIAGA